MNAAELNLTTKQMVYYHSKKRSKVLAYVIGAILGGMGGHGFYIGGDVGHSIGALILGLLIASLVIPQLMIAHSILVLTGVVYTHFLVDKRNKELMEEAIMLMGEE